MEAQHVYLPSDDVTITVDPIRDDLWIYDGHERKFDMSRQKGWEYDLNSIRMGLDWDKAHNSTPIELYMPSTRHLDSLKKFNEPQGSRCRGWNGQERDPARWGLLPAITQMLYDGKLPNKSAGDIEAEMREAERRLAGRVFDRSGVPR